MSAFPSSFLFNYSVRFKESSSGKSGSDKGRPELTDKLNLHLLFDTFFSILSLSTLLSHTERHLALPQSKLQCISRWTRCQRDGLAITSWLWKSSHLIYSVGWLLVSWFWKLSSYKIKVQYYCFSSCRMDPVPARRYVLNYSAPQKEANWANWTLWHVKSFSFSLIDEGCSMARICSYWSYI